MILPDRGGLIVRQNKGGITKLGIYHEPLCIYLKINFSEFMLLV
jgi:hypothetical protein